MNKIKDERLVLRNLKNIRIAFLFQTLGIITILCKEHFMDGKSFSDLPLFLVFILTGVIMSFLSMGISVDNEVPEKSSILNSYKWILILSITVGALFTFISLMSSNEIPFTRALIGGLIVFICFLVAFSVGYFMKKKRSDGLDD
ncbi:DUF6773 family protein [Clostridium algidicarnis]|uniref:Branched-chain amino acid ABC transporter substrate-binding protein n=1 Tax=Clostridium algidicarnis DSM 15099 TaxID=1121295 RepID=A0A2S6FXK7_9CLOT|nr:DUF6773 family protein [Clostridium algidicarnis]PPK48337.1 hypothetical protein BD821_10898 [Clostridium algidicarnis DSM 15099]